MNTPIEQLYYFTGLIFIWILSFFGILFIAFFLIKSFIEILAKKTKSLWIIVEYALNRENFKKYKKEK
jgi:hypothetical protein